MSPDRGKRTKATRTKGSRTKASVRAATQLPGPGASYVARWHPAADAERDASWPAGEKVAMLNAAHKLEATGPRLGHPHSSAVQGEAGKGFRELRPRAGRSRWRPIYRQVTAETFVIFALGPEAQIDGRGFDAAVERAVARFADFEVD